MTVMLTGGFQGVHSGCVAVQREGRQAIKTAICVPYLRHGQRRVHLQRRALSGGYRAAYVAHRITSSLRVISNLSSLSAGPEDDGG